MRVARGVEFLARVVVVLSLMAAFEVVLPDHRRTEFPASAASVGSGACTQTVGDATNVTVTTSGSTCIVKFLSTTTWTAPGISSMKLLVVGGGGGGGGGSRSTGDGGRGGGGGGGGGNTVYKSAYSVSSSTVYTVTVGAGGAGGASNNVHGGFGSAGSAGSSSSISGSGAATVTASGGGGGTAETSVDGSNSGGDGGGSAQTVESTVTARYGGGNNWEGAGGGAGAGGNGVDGTDIGGRGGNGGNGGVGYATDITGSSITYAGGGGGGGTKGDDINNGTAGTGGSGGGGNGGILSTVPVAGTSGLGGGGGGGGGWRDDTYLATSGAAGGSGVVVISFAAPAMYTVSYDTRGGSAADSVSWIKGTSLTLPAAPTRAGYTFSGWSTSAEGSSLVYQTTMPTRSGNNIVYSANYGKGGSDAAATLTSQGATFSRVRYRMEAKYNGSASPYYADVSFDKWAGATISDLAIPDMGDQRLIKTNVSNMTIDSNWPGFAGTASAVTTGSGKSGRLELWARNYAQGTTGISPAGSGSIYDNDDTQDVGGEYGSFQVHNLTDSETVFAWNHHGVGNPDIGFGKNLKYCSNGYHTDWTFCGNGLFDISSTSWKLQIYIGDLFAASSSYLPVNNANFTLYAQWAPNTLNVTYDSHGGSAISAGTTVTDGSIAASPGTPTRAGYTFNGWFAAASGGSALTFPYTHGKTSDFTLHAQWTANTLNVTYNSQGGSAISGGTTVTDGSISTSPGTPTKGTDVFRGWFAAASGGSALTFPYTHGRTANFTLYAQWQTDQSALSVTNAPATLAFSASVTLGTSGGSGSGAVSFATSTPSVCSVVANTGAVSMLSGTGSCSVTATKASDADFKSASVEAVISAVPANQSVLSITGPATGTYNTTVSLSTSGGSTSGAVTWSAGASTACTVNSSGVVSITSGTGTCSVTATMAGSTDYNVVSSSAHAVTVSKASQATLTVSSTDVDYGDTLSLASSGGSGTGAVTWTKVSGTCTLAGSTLTPGNVGSSCVVKATKASDSNYLVKNSADTTVTVNKAAQTGFRVTGSTSFTTGSALVLSTTGGQSGGSVSWDVTSGTCTLSGSTLSAARGGITCVVEATKAGDTNYRSVTDSITVTVNKIVQNLTVRSSAPSPATVGSTYTVTVDSDAFLAPTIVIANSSSSVCSVLAGVVTFNSAGTCLISVSQSGNDTYSSAAASQSVTVVAASLVSVPPAVTTTVVAAQVGMTTTSVSASAPVDGTTTTSVVSPVPKSATGPGSAVAATTTTSTTTTTTTTIPADPSQPQAGADGKAPELKAGETTALIRGQLVKVTVEQVDDSIVLTLPNKVRVTIGPSGPGSKSVTVAADGVLRMYRNDFVDVVATGLVPGTTYTVFMFSQPVELGRGVADADGRAVASVQVPKDAATKSHTLQVNGVGPGGEVVTTSIGITVLKKTSSTGITVLALTLAILLALLGGRPIYVGRRRRGNR